MQALSLYWSNSSTACMLKKIHNNIIVNGRFNLLVKLNLRLNCKEASVSIIRIAI